MKKTHQLLLATFLGASALTSSAFAGGEGWTADFEAAKKLAAEEKKDLLVDFTGSDWCGWCIKLNKEVFSHEPFKKGVADKFILVEIDFPRDKSKLSEETQKQNAELQAKYGVRGFPTILLMDSSGVPFAKTGYQAGGPEAYVAHLDELRTKRTVRDEAFAEAEKLEGAAKADALVTALSAIDDEVVATHYKEKLEEIAKLSPDNEYSAKMNRMAATKALQQDVMASMRAGDTEAISTKVDGFIEKHSLEGLEKQKILGMKMDPYLRTGKFDEAEAVLEEIIKADPESPEGKRAEGFKPRLKQMREQAAKKATP